MNIFKLLIISTVLVMAPIIGQANESFIEIIKQVSPAVVVVSVEQTAPEVGNLMEKYGEELEDFGFPKEFLDSLITPEDLEEDPEPRKMYSSGTGFLIEDYIVTNHHVIDGGEAILVHFQGSPKRYAVEVIGSDATADLAVLRFIDPPPSGIKSLEWSDIPLQSGQDVWAIGHPRGLEYSVTKGIVSSVNRTASNNWQISVQTDASVNRGNSGGPLLDMSGAVVAVNTLIITSSGGFEGVSVSVQGDYAQGIIEKLLTGKPIDRPLMGILVAGTPMSSEAWVAGTVKDSPGEQAGIETDDIFYEMDGKRIEYAQDIYEVLRTHQPGDTISAVFLRGDDREQISVSITFASMIEADEKLKADKLDHLRGE